MPYKTGRNINPALFAREREMLLAGFNYSQIADATGSKRKTTRERNRIIHKVNIWEAFEQRIQRDGIPDRLNVSDAFGYWFSGFFDGEGCITVFYRKRPDRYAEYRHLVRIQIRDDDTDIITRIQDNLKVGRVSHHGKRGATNPSIAWACEAVNDLAEVIIPLFDRYPLHTKKRNEFAIWKSLVNIRYIDTMGGYSNRCKIPENHRVAFMDGLEAIQKIRTYTITV